MGRSPTTISSAHRRLLKRSLRIGLAAALATLCSQLLHLPNPWFATVAAIVAMQSTLQATFRSGRNSILGAFIGAVLGLGVATVASDQAWAVGVVVTAPLVVFGWFRLRSIGQQAALVASVVVLVPSRPELTTLQFAVVRFGQAAIGIVVAMAVQALVFPPRAHRQVRRELAGIYLDMAQLLVHVTAVLDQQPFAEDAVRRAR
ncbi:MAG: FUSC family protein, partial [Actinobacteria bacterium]|nr:FUSC family protein [Actinomycetota bacterium]